MQQNRGLIGKPLVWSIAATVILLLLLDRSSKQTSRSGSPPPGYCQQATECIICAHGGDGAKAAPNTVEGHTHAVAAGFRCSEVDVAMTSDGHLVSVHARELSTLLPPGSQHNPADTTRLTWPEIRALHYPRGERVPLVEDVLTAVSGRVDLVVLDVKLPDDADDALVQRMVDAVGGLLARARCGGSNCTTVWSKHDAWVRAFKARHAQIPTGFIVNEPVGGSESDTQRLQRATRVAEAEVVGAVWSVLDTRLVDTLHSMGRQVYGFTANELHMTQRILGSGADVVITSYPHAVRQVMRHWARQCGKGKANKRMQQQFAFESS